MTAEHVPGDVIADRYRVIGRLGRGGAGTTYEAECVDDGRRVALKQLSLWSGGDWKLLELEIAASKNAVDELAFLPDGRALVSAADDRTVRVWSSSDGKPIRTLGTHHDEVWSAALSHDGRLLATGDKAGALTVEDVASGALVAREPSADRRGIAAVSFSPDGRSSTTFAALLLGSACWTTCGCSSDLIKRLQPRWFLIRDAHASDGVKFLQPRYAMSFLKGPMTRVGLRRALAGRGAAAAAVSVDEAEAAQ